ncbi:Coatomer delta subunit [Giardia muris]|uniref:Coatomer delta subunit n=1 Tax=Giardia muris TaxID=5742 RepID=A0A4Z1SUG6_GIAMU|nr:Coatomer delta subunit [Giardia muris]|eukprot:TNJ29484.1 Coatomer delta subunit [Giardia muris]
MTIIAVGLLDLEGVPAVVRSYRAEVNLLTAWDALSRHLSSATSTARLTGAITLEDGSLLYRACGELYLAILCTRDANLVETEEVVTVLLSLLEALGPLKRNSALFDALFAIDETILYGTVDRPVTVAGVQERLRMHSEAEDRANEERLRKEAEAERIRKAREAELAARRGEPTGALGLLSRAKGWLLGEKPQKKEWGHGVPEEELRKMRMRSQGASAAARSSSSSDDSDDSGDDSERSWDEQPSSTPASKSVSTVEPMKPKTTPESKPLATLGSSESSESEPRAPVPQPSVTKGITLPKRR